jgi:DNA-directed RNA polymerase subunit RPC12/RpoP
VVKLSCGSCGAKLTITNDLERFACAHCGTEWLVRRKHGVVSLRAVEEQVAAIRDNTDLLASREKLHVLTEHSEVLRYRVNAILQEQRTLESNIRLSLVAVSVGLALARSWMADTTFGLSHVRLTSVAMLAVAGALLVAGYRYAQPRLADLERRLGEARKAADDCLHSMAELKARQLRAARQ